MTGEGVGVLIHQLSQNKGVLPGKGGSLALCGTRRQVGRAWADSEPSSLFLGPHLDTVSSWCPPVITWTHLEDLLTWEQVGT